MRTLFAAFLALLIIVVLWIVSGTYNVAAVNPHSDAMNWLFATVRDRSVANHSQEIQPPSLQDPALVQAGLQEYHTMCFTCHAAPGHEASEIGKGLNPEPPKLEAKETQARSDAELYWIIKNGLRMTGMPAFGPTHDEKALWSLVAFLRQLPKTNQQEYSAMVEAAGLREKADGHSHQHVRSGANKTTSMREEEADTTPPQAHSHAQSLEEQKGVPQQQGLGEDMSDHPQEHDH